MFHGPAADVRTRSAVAGRAFHRAAAAELRGGIADRGIHGDEATKIGRKQGALTGSIRSKVPVLLAELCVLSNPKDEAFVASEGGFNRMCSAVEKGVLEALRALKLRSNAP